MNHKISTSSLCQCKLWGFLPLSRTASAPWLCTGERHDIRTLDKACLLSLLNLSMHLMLLTVTSFLNIWCTSWRLFFSDFIPVYPALLPATGSKHSPASKPCPCGPSPQPAAVHPLQLHSQLSPTEPRGERPLQIPPGAERQGRLPLDSLSSAVNTGTYFWWSCISQDMD